MWPKQMKLAPLTVFPWMLSVRTITSSPTGGELVLDVDPGGGFGVDGIDDLSRDVEPVGDALVILAVSLFGLFGVFLVFQVYLSLYFFDFVHGLIC